MAAGSPPAAVADERAQHQRSRYPECVACSDHRVGLGAVDPGALAQQAAE